MIIFLHGFGSTGDTSSTGARIKSEFPNEEVVNVTYDFLNPLADVVRIAEYVRQQDDVILIGVSLGGFIARYIASICPNVSKLILLNPSLRANETLHKYEGDVVNGRVVPPNFSEQYNIFAVNRDRVDLPIFLVVCRDDDVVDPSVALETFSDRASILIETGGHSIPFNENVLRFINNAINIEFG